MKTLQTVLAILIFGLFPFISVGQNSFYDGEVHKKGIAVGIKLTSFGPGADVVATLTKKLNVRAGVAYFPYKYNQSIVSGDATTINSKAKLGAVTLGVDWQFVRFMYLSGGLIYNFSTINFDVVPTTPTPEDNGLVAYHLEPNHYCPYLSVGIGRTISRNKIVSFGFDIGLAYQGTTSVDYVVTPTISSTKLTKWTNNIKSGSKYYKFYPIINFLVAFRLF
ncbi:MAG: hypothetical protein K9G61_04910 [Bacteroidales bacterium]|nr:hypothetical protein [Bacteroidales bacterium]